MRQATFTALLSTLAFTQADDSRMLQEMRAEEADYRMYEEDVAIAEKYHEEEHESRDEEDDIVGEANKFVEETLGINIEDLINETGEECT